MLFHENSLLVVDSHETSYLIFFKNLERLAFKGLKLYIYVPASFWFGLILYVPVNSYGHVGMVT